MWLIIVGIVVTAGCVLLVLVLASQSAHLASGVGMPYVPPCHIIYHPAMPYKPPAALVRHYMVMPGDTLWGIAKAKCGNPLDWPRLWHANMITDPNLIYPKEMLVLDC